MEETQQNELIISVRGIIHRIFRLPFAIYVLTLLVFGLSSCDNQKQSQIIASYILASERSDTLLQREIVEENQSDIDLISSLIAKEKGKLAEFELNALGQQYRDALQKLYSSGKTQAIHDLAELVSELNDKPSVADKWLQFQIIYRHIILELNQERSFENIEKDFAKLKSIAFRNSVIKSFSEIITTSLEAEIKKKQGNTTAAIISINKCLAILQTENLQDAFPALEFELYNIYLSFLTVDKSIDPKDIYKNFILDKLDKNKKQNAKDSFTKDYYRLEKLNTHSQPDSSRKFLHSITSKYPKEDISFNSYLNLQISLATKWESLDHQVAKEVWNKIDDLAPAIECNSNIYISLLTRLDNVETKNEYTEILQKIELFAPCFTKNPYLEYLTYLYTSDNPFVTSDLLTRIKGVRNQRKVAKKIWGTEPNFHILDLFALNTVDYLELISKLAKDEQTKFYPELPILFAETKAIELKLKRALILSSTIKSDQKKLAELIRKTNDFTDTLYDGHPIYFEIYNLYEKKQISDGKEQEILSTSKEKIISYDKLKTQLAKRQTTVINLLKYEDSYWAYTFSSDSFFLSKIDASSIDKLNQELHIALYNREDISSHLQQLRALLPTISPTEKLLIIPDGDLSTLPFELVYQLPEEIQYHFDLYEWANQEEKRIKSNRGSIFSYSDQQTINSLKPREFTELPIGLQECKSIHKLLAEAPSMEAGTNFTKETLSKMSNADFIHFSTHASMNKRNRLDNFLLIRNEEGNPEALFSYEIEQWAKSPTVVIFSACDTGQGIHKIAAGTYSLSRGFLLAGSETVIKSLWQVNEAATAEFMTHLYAKWINNMTISQALKETKKIMSTSEKFGHPYFWSGFVLEGNADIFLE